MVLVPGKRGLSVNSSTATHPRANTSMATVDFLIPIRFSGDLYHLVATQSVQALYSSLASPKSISLTSATLQPRLPNFLLMSMFSGLISLWMILPRCRYSKANAHWYRMHLTWCSLMPYLEDVYSSSRFYSMNSKTTRVCGWPAITSFTFMMFGWASREAIFSSREISQSRSGEECDIYFIATSQLLRRLRALNTSLKLPLPALERTWYFSILIINVNKWGQYNCRVGPKVREITEGKMWTQRVVMTNNSKLRIFGYL